MAPRPGVRNQFWSFGTGTSFQKLAPVSKFNSGILNWGTRVQESTLAFKNRLWNHGPGQLFQEAFWLFLSQLWNFGEAPFFSGQLWNLGSGDLLSTLGSWVVFFGCKRFVLRSWLWRLWNLGPCVGLAVLSRVGSLVSNRIFASAPVLICFDQSFFGISGATCIQSLLGWGTCFQDLGLGHLFWNFGSGCLFQGPALESWLGAFFSGLLVKKTILMHVCFHLPPCF